MPSKAKDRTGTPAPLIGRGPQQTFDEFRGKLILVDLNTVDRDTEDFEGREWMEGRLRDSLAFGWDLEWVPDRRKEADNPIALMQFSDESTCLLLRCHKSRNWLPSTVIKVLESADCLKIGVGWDGPDKTKMKLSFNMLPLGIVDLSAIAKQKGLAEQGLKSLSEYFGWKMRKDTRVARSNWACLALSEEQCQYAAEDAYFTYLLLEKLQFLPDPTEEAAIANTPNGGVIELQPGWSDQGILRKHDGLWCSMCEKGPMTVAMVVLRHMEGAKHRRKYEQTQTHRTNAAVELSQDYLDQGIFSGTGHNDVKVGEFKCSLCDAGPFNSMAVVASHLSSKRHQKAYLPAPEPIEEEEDEGEEVEFISLEGLVWNIPDYVTLENEILCCTLCDAKANAVLPMSMHLGGDKHARKCRSHKHDEIVYIKERERLESMNTGQAVIRSGFRLPRQGETEQPGHAKEAKIIGKAPQPGALPPGWEEFVDEKSGGYLYYFHAETNATTWVRPSLPPPQQPDCDTNRLPPGWQAVWVEASNLFYYADPETQTAQWDPPAAYLHADWKRCVDDTCRAFWASFQENTTFYEADEAWQRLLDEKDIVYWSNRKSGLRFFEENPSA